MSINHHELDHETMIELSFSTQMPDGMIEWGWCKPTEKPERDEESESHWYSNYGY